jgi:arsenate reductase
MIKVLFVCIHNSARSQMAEAFMNLYGAGKVIAESAGLEPGELNPIIVELMKEVNIDISGNKTKSVFDFYKQGRLFDYVITVCDESNSERCPVFPGITNRLHWSFKDPSNIESADIEEKKKEARIIRDGIRDRILAFLDVLA